jgi:hypothetical protein
MKLQRMALGTLLVSLALLILLTTVLTNRQFVSTTEQTENSQSPLMKSIIEFHLASLEGVAWLPRTSETPGLRP